MRLLVGAGVLFTVAFVVIGAAATLPLLLAAALLYGLGEGVFIPTLQDIVAGAATPEQRGAVVAVWVGAARAGQTAGPLMAAAVYGATSTSTTFMLGGAVAGGLVVYELVGRLRRRSR